jgi:hypothetical protein
MLDDSNALHSDIAALTGAEYIDAGAAVLDHGRWTATMPCLVTEPCTGSADGIDHGVNVVRSPDGTHFCPTAGTAEQGVTDGCAVWSSGAYRFGSAMAVPIIHDQVSRSACPAAAFGVPAVSLAKRASEGRSRS